MKRSQQDTSLENINLDNDITINPHKKQKKESSELNLLNLTLLDSARIHSIAEEYKNNTPFPYVQVSDIFDEDFTLNLKQELLDQTFTEKNNDLYTFEQTKEDLETLNGNNINKLRDMLYCNEFKNWIEKITGCSINSQISLSGFKYFDTSYLTVHDDELEGRKIAFILYFVPKDWNEKDGGNLELFDTKNGQPKSIVKSILPKFNSFLFFEVKPNTSYHQVAQIIGNKERISIGGWFHSNEKKQEIQEKKEEYKPKDTFKYIKFLNFEDFNKHSINVNPIYLKKSTQESISQHFISQGSITLQSFYEEKFYKENIFNFVSDLKFKKIGPPNFRNYFSWKPKEEESCSLLDNFNSYSFVKLIESFTNFEIDVKKNFSFEVRKFENDNYTLIYDGAKTKEKYLRIVFYCIKDNWDSSFGGSTEYTNGEEELLSIEPVSNTISLVLVEEGVMDFVKYVNHYAKESLIEVCLNFPIC